MAARSARRARRQRGPEQVSVIMYNVGFGDCFLLRFSYSNDMQRQVLIDCGSTSKTKDQMARVVDKLVEDSGGHVDAVVATHRHKDHIGAFGLAGIGRKLEALNPEVVIQPWTEHPDAETAAVEAPTVFTRGAVKHMMGLNSAQQFAKSLTDEPSRVLAAAGPRTRAQLTRIAELSIPNKRAILQLTRMGKRHAYVYAGSRSGLEGLLPGVRVSVLGPPTLKQSETIRQQTSWDEAEFWKLYARLANESATARPSGTDKSALFNDAQTSPLGKAPSHVKWMVRKLDEVQLYSARRIVRDLDDAINNTSVILLFEVADKALLFSGDAQLENWLYALSDRGVRERLRKTTLYKVGHHGSTNATPQSLWNLFRYRKKKRRQLVSLLSTKRGHHSGVPRSSLVRALEDETDLYSTQGWGRKLRDVFVL